uniref:Protein disulfide-isomerase n=1 Tax=Hemiscolopendra marginata TaxID=943146 RepID=A0A646QE81_9MYRI
MWKFIILSFCLVVTLASDVLEFTDSDFAERIKEHDTYLVEFYAPWCGHCKRLAPEYEKAATVLKDNDPPIPLVKVDCIESGKETCGKFGVSGYPTLKIFRNGEFSQEYNGPREANGIIKYMSAQVGPSSKELTNLKEIETFLEKEGVSIIGFFDSEDVKLKATFQKVADKMRESARFGHSLSPEVLKKYGYTNEVVLFRPKHLENKFEDTQVKYDGDKSDKQELEEFINKNYHGLVGHRTTDSASQFSSPLIVAYYKVDYVKNIKGTNYWRNRIMKVASGFKNRVNFAISNKDEFTHELSEYGFNYVAGDKPVVAARNAKSEKFVMEGEFSMESFEKFINDFLEEKLKPYLKSEPIPEKNDEPVKVAVAQNFDALVNKNEKDILIEFYAPWCGHCKKLAPTFDELGKALEEEDTVEIVKMDATANDVPSPYEVHGFPTLYWAPRDKKDKPTRYDGGREFDDFIKYIAKHSTEELKTYNRNGKKKKDKSEL